MSDCYHLPVLGVLSFRELSDSELQRIATATSDPSMQRHKLLSECFTKHDGTPRFTPAEWAQLAESEPNATRDAVRILRARLLRNLPLTS